ncbi:hypothetical protein QTN47_21850 [Danxiaibacter flavus]|uniref:Zinc-finger domain-containing protein n=1 Tax=Danxiaibacter flavus TaxID=3049108 RepID=A0ABV3ZNS7_9BACT|nr:hypothetical protein QNM32_21855 [Chitinophagaceae bacterium DXS]
MEIQLFIFEEEKCAIHVVEHIKHCPQCAIKAAEYNVLVEGIEQLEKPAFDFALADLVVEQLPQPQLRARFDSLFLYIIAFVVISFVATALYFFKDTRLNLAWKTSPASTGLIITTVACIGIFLLADLFRKYQRQMHAANFIE